MASDSGSMYNTAARLVAIWWLAEATVPRRAMNSAIRVKDVTSTMMDSPAGTPKRKNCRSTGHWGFSGRRHSW